MSLISIWLILLYLNMSEASSAGGDLPGSRSLHVGSTTGTFSCTVMDPEANEGCRMSPSSLKGGFILRTCRMSQGSAAIRCLSTPGWSLSPSPLQTLPSTNSFYQGICGCVWIERGSGALGVPFVNRIRMVGSPRGC